MLTYKGYDFIINRIAANSYKPINAMYLEFTNSSVPTVVPDPADQLNYYLGLSSTDSDFLRVPLVQDPSYVSTDTDKYTGNKVTFWVSTEGYTTGYHGKAFSGSAGSKIYGVALVAVNDISDITHDIIITRSYGITPIEKSDASHIIIATSFTLDTEILSSSSI